MKKLNRNTIVYSLNIEDVQTVALEEIGRELSQTEIKIIKDSIASSINWFDAVANAINKEVKVEEHS